MAGVGKADQANDAAGGDAGDKAGDQVEGPVGSKGARKRGPRAVLVGAAGGAGLQLRAPRADWFDEAKKATFFAHLTATSNVTDSAKAAGVGLQSVYQRRRRDPDFAKRWDQAKADAVADLEMRALAQGRFGRQVVVEQARSDDGLTVTRTARHDEASLTLQRMGKHSLSIVASDDVARLDNEAAEHRARVDAAISLLSQGVREILRGGRDG